MYPIVLLKIMQRNDADLSVRQQAAIQFKNTVKHRWFIRNADPEQKRTELLVEIREQIKTHILNVMVSVPKILQAQVPYCLFFTHLDLHYFHLLPGRRSSSHYRRLRTLRGIRFKLARGTECFTSKSDHQTRTGVGWWDSEVAYHSWSSKNGPGDFHEVNTILCSSIIRVFATPTLVAHP